MDDIIIASAIETVIEKVKSKVQEQRYGSGWRVLQYSDYAATWTHEHRPGALYKSSLG